MLSGLLGKEAVPVSEDPRVIETERAFRAAQSRFDNVRCRYERLKMLTHLPAARSLGDLGASAEEQDQAIIDFPAVAREFAEAKQQADRARAAYETAYGQAYAARQRFYHERIREKERALVSVIAEQVLPLVADIHNIVEQASLEQVRVEPTRFSDLPLRVGTRVQGGIETVLEEYQQLMQV